MRAADQVELVDMTAEALRRRMAHGNIYPPEKIDAALTNYFRAGNLTALRELALLWLADKVDEGLQQYRAAARHHRPPGRPRERVVVALTGGPEGETLIRRAARIAARSSGGDLLAVHVTAVRRAGRRRTRRTWPGSGTLVESLGGTYHQVVGDDISDALLDLRAGRERDPAGARRQPPVLAAGAAHRAGHRVDGRSATPAPIDVHIVTHAHVGSRLRAAAAGTGAASRRGGGSPGSRWPRCWPRC